MAGPSIAAHEDRATAFFRALLARPLLSVLAGLILLAVVGAGLPRVVKDPSVDAFVPADHPAALARDAARDMFGLEDPMVVALAAPKGTSIFTPNALDALRAMQDSLRLVEGVKKNDVISLASERAILGRGGDLIVEDILPAGPITPETAQAAQRNAAAMPVLSGLLLSEAEDMALIILPVVDANRAEAVYGAVKAQAEALAPAGHAVHVAGVAAMNAKLAGMVSENTKRFIPLAVLVVLAFLWVALGRGLAVLGPFIVIAGAATIGIGTMGWLDARYYLISAALPVVIMAIAVADSLHISTFYMSARRENPALSAHEAAAGALANTWLPVTLTSVTTVAGFTGLSFGAAMQPISEFGWFASAGVIGALMFSLTVLPAIMILTNLQPGRQSLAARLNARLDWLAAATTQLALRAPGKILLAFTAMTIALGALATQSAFDYERKRYFLEDEPVRIADAAISERLGGVNFLDVVISAPEEGGLLTPAALTAIADLRAQIADLPHVVKVSGIDQYISVMHSALTAAAPGTLPTKTSAPAQYMFLYEASAPPDDFRQEIDYLQQNALVRAQLSTDRFRETAPVVTALETLVTRWAADTELSASVSGRVAVNEGWMSLLAHNHFRGLGLAALLVWLAALVSFRSLVPSLLVMIPVLTGVLAIYAVMGLLDIAIAPATSMMAAISTGLGVDFGVHLMAHVRRARANGESWQQAFSGHYVLVARACFFSAIALALALSVLLISTVPVLKWFGLLIATGAIGSLAGAMFILPALQLISARQTHGVLQNA